ncbi:MAG: double-cubane-cluster-containing anaerobic reductase [Dehalococcoidia bacterium]|jgi:benzoyl-CoA reductase/2-hydroxyglutaryl-CoA dehydratase subunit BcrC/BadD/HgdB
MKAIDLEHLENLRLESISQAVAAKEKGAKIVGLYCTYCPRELVIAAGAMPFGLCGTREVTAETELPRNLCPLIQSSYGLAVANQCPYFEIADLIIGETTCDGKKKMFEIMDSKGLNDIYVMNLPQMPSEAASLQLWIEELKRLKSYLETKFEVVITDRALREAIHFTNEENRSRKRLFDLNKNGRALISGMDMMTVSSQVMFLADRMESVRILDELVDEIEADALSAAENSSPKRILLTGTPVGIGSEKVIRLVEEGGGIVVAMENCSGYKTVDLNIDEADPSDPLLLMAQKYLKTPCSVMSPNKGRLELLKTMIRDFQVEGVIDLTWQACLTYSVESYFVSEMVQNELGLPFLQIDTDYSQSDLERLRVRIEALLEMM